MKKLICIFPLLFGLALARNTFAGTLAQIFTSVGEVDVELYDHDKPVTVGNFIRLAEASAYQDSFFHRCVPGFVIQGGGYYAYNPDLTDVIGPPYANLAYVGNFGNITNEYNVGAFYSNVYGTIAMAKTSDPNSANSQFFFNLADNSSSLDNTNNSGGFTVFGQVVSGTNYLNEFNAVSIGNHLVDLTATYGANGLGLTDLPTFATGTAPPPYNELIYFGVEILTLQLSLNNTNGWRQLSWYSVNGATNNVEFATNLPPVWQVLVSTNGNGGLYSVNDSSTNKTGRFYRLHVLF